MQRNEYSLAPPNPLAASSREHAKLQQLEEDTMSSLKVPYPLAASSREHAKLEQLEEDSMSSLKVPFDAFYDHLLIRIDITPKIYRVTALPKCNLSSGWLIRKTIFELIVFDYICFEFLVIICVSGFNWFAEPVEQ